MGKTFAGSPVDQAVRVVVVGNSGSGKSSVAAESASRLQLPHVELDSLFHQPGWQPADPEVFRDRVTALAATGRWVVDGNYRAVRDVLWPRATTIVWLDLPLRVTLPRLVRRTFRRIIGRVELWNENRERIRHLFHPDHPIWWTLRRHRDRRRTYERQMDDRWVRLRTTAQVDEWLASLPEPTRGSGTR